MRKSLIALSVFTGLQAITQAHALDPRPGVKVRALEKITGKATDLEIELDETIEFGGIGLTVRACYQSPPEEQPPESAAYLEVISMKSDVETGVAKEDDPRLFAGWMFASSPGRNALEHPLYDVWVTSCSAALPGSENEDAALTPENGVVSSEPEASETFDSFEEIEEEPPYNADDFESPSDEAMAPAEPDSSEGDSEDVFDIDTFSLDDLKPRDSTE